MIPPLVFFLNRYSLFFLAWSEDRTRACLVLRLNNDPVYAQRCQALGATGERDGP